MSRRITLTFAVADDPPALFDTDGEKISTEQTDSDSEVTFGEYEYTSSPAFGGNSSTSEGELYWKNDTNLVAVVTYSDQPKGKTLFRELSEETDTDVSAPEYPQEASTQFYRTFGFNGYTTSFREGLMDYSYESSYQSIEPEEILKERAMGSRRRSSDDWLDEITEELTEDGYYVSSMDCMFEENGNQYMFTNPMRVASIPKDEWDDDLLRLIFQRMEELHNNEVPTVEEVLS